MGGLIGLVLLGLWLLLRAIFSGGQPRTSRTGTRQRSHTTIPAGGRSSRNGAAIPIGETNRRTPTVPIDPILATLVKMGFTKSEAKRWAATIPGQDHGERLRQIFQQYDRQR